MAAARGYRTTDRIAVKDHSGEGDYEFVYTVCETRHGYEDEEVARQPQQSHSTGPSSVTTNND